MVNDYSEEIAIIVNTLLQVGERVMEVSREHVISKIWDRKDSLILGSANNYLGKKISDVLKGNIITRCDDRLEQSFLTGENSYFEYTPVAIGTALTFGIRIITCHPDKNYVFVVVENLQVRNEGERMEDNWEMILDAIGDGAFETNLGTHTIRFSKKWHEIFGYSENEITTMEEWSAKIHPGDLNASLKRFEKYVSGESPYYSSEMRYLCKDGSYKWFLSRGIIISKTIDGKPLRFIGTHTDINERKIAEERYAATAQLLAKLINNLQRAIIVTDENRKIVFVNQMFYDMYATDGNFGELIGLDMEKNLETRKYAYKNPEKFLNRTVDIFNKKEIVLNEEWELEDGRILSRDYIPLSLGGNNKGGIWKFKDITDQKNIERRFEEQRLFYERIINNIPADIAIFDAEHRYLFVNQNAFKNEELRKWMIGKTDEDYARYSNRPYSFVETRFALYDKAVQSREQVRYIEKLISKDGKVGHHLRLLRPVFFEDGSLEFIMAYGLEITDLILAQEELKTSMDTFSSAFDHSGIGMALIDTEGLWLDANKVLCDLTGYSKEELLKLTHNEITYPEDDEIDRPLIVQLQNKEITTYTIEKRYVSKKNKIILVSLTVSLVWNNDGTPKFFIAQVVDITQKNELENEITRKNTQLEATITSLVNKISQLEELNHIIAHNLRGPAGNIKMFSEILLTMKKDKVDSENLLSDAFSEEEVLGFIEESSSSLMNSLSTLMEISEIKLNKEIAYDDCNIINMINVISSQLYGNIFEKQAIINLNLKIEIIRYPKAYLENILYNLVSNALKYCKPGIPPEIYISTRVQNEKIQIIVKDNGLGIDLKKYGDKVFKLNQVFHPGYDSKGIGLYITKTQVESLGGNIELISKPNEGCEFIVTL